MLLDPDRHRFDLDLLHHAGRCRRRLQAVATGGTDLCHMRMRTTVKQFRRNERTFVALVSGLTSNADFRSNLSCLNDTQLSGRPREAPMPWR